MKNTLYTKVVFAACVVTLCLLMLGAYTRLSDAGLGCPDWPGCYGQLTVPQSEEALQNAQNLYPDKPVESHKAWIEMAHRYVAGVLGLMILWLAIVAIKRRFEPKQPVLLPLALLVVVIFQALLGMWTVTQLVYPAIVTAHLLGGMLTISLLWLLYLCLRFPGSVLKRRQAPIVMFVAFLLVIQIALGGWVSTNYAALACTDFPGCYTGKVWPSMALIEAFDVRMVEGLNYEGGVLSADARATIHMVHRLGALVVSLAVLLLALSTLFGRHHQQAKGVALAVIALLVLQVGLGIANIYFSLPLSLAVLHNGGAAALLLGVLTLWHCRKHR